MRHGHPGELAVEVPFAGHGRCGEEEKQREYPIQDLLIRSTNMVGSFVERRPGKEGFEAGGTGVPGGTSSTTAEA
jgi:hypothetical protein